MTPARILPFVLFLAAGVAGAAPGDIPDARVVLPWADFKALYEKGMAPEKKPETAPRDFALSRAVYEGEVEGESTTFKARMKVEVLKAEGWVSVPLLPTTVALRSARLGGRDAPIYMDNGWYRLVTDRKGVLDLELDFAVATWETGGQYGFTFAMAPSGGTEVTVTVPSEELLEFQVANAQQVERTDLGDRMRLQVLLPASGNLAVNWQRALAADAGGVEVAEAPRLYAEHQALMGVAEGLLQVNSAVHYSILHAGVDHLQVTLPADVTLLDVKGNGIRDWRVEPAGDRQAVGVDLNFEAKGSYSLYLDYERPLPDGTTSVLVPDLQVQGVERVKGWVGVDARSAVELAGGAVENASVVDVRELPTAILGQTDWPVLLAYKYRKQDYRIPVEIREHEDVAVLVTIVDSLDATTVMTRDGRRMTRMAWSMRNNRAQFLRLALPEGAEVWSASVAGRAVKPARAEDGRVLVPLARSQAAGNALAQFVVELVYVEGGAAPDGRGAGEFAARLPAADVPATACRWTVFVPEETRVKKKTLETTLREVDHFTAVSVDQYGYASMEMNAALQQQASRDFAGEAMAAGVTPVEVSLPVEGRPLYFEKLLVLDEPLEVGFRYGGIDR